MKRFLQAMLMVYTIAFFAFMAVMNSILIDGLQSPWAILTWTSGSLSMALLIGVMLPLVNFWSLMPSAIWDTQVTDRSVMVHSSIPTIISFTALNLMMVFPILIYYQKEITGAPPNDLAILISVGAVLLTVFCNAWFFKYYRHGTTIELTEEYLIVRNGSKSISVTLFDHNTIIRADGGKKAGLYFQNAKRTAHRERFFSDELVTKTSDAPFLSATSFGKEGFEAACRILDVDINYPKSLHSNHYY